MRRCTAYILTVKREVRKVDNLNISFAPDKSAEDKGRINAVEDYLSLLTERIKFCFNGIDENIAQKSDG